MTVENPENNKNSPPIVETVSDDDGSYIEIEVLTDDEEEIEDAPQPKFPPRPHLKSPEMTPLPYIASKTMDRAPPPASAPPVTPDHPPIPLTPSRQRAKAAGSAGLSELSKQLRILQAKNESQSVDINRLERQLRILADLQGVNVADLRKALEDACASEAFGELQNRVAKLRYELEAATLAKQGELRRDATAPHIANLELRVGELEEVEEKQKAEIRHLYQQLQHEREKSTRLESENELLKKEMDDLRTRLQQEVSKTSRLQTEFQEQMNRFQEDQLKKMKDDMEKARSQLRSMEQQGTGGNSLNITSTNSFSPEMLAEYERMVKMLKERDEQLRSVHARLNAQEIKFAGKFKDLEDEKMNLKVETDKMKLMVKELEDAEDQSGLRLAQYKARFAVQDERIQDLDQQLDSLYAAFTLLKEEFDSENTTRAAMMSNLREADEEIARQANKLEKQKSLRGRGFPPANEMNLDTSGSYHGSNRSIQSVPRMISTPQTAMLSPAAHPTPSSRDAYSSSDGREDFDTSLAYASAKPYKPSPERTLSTWQLLFPKDDQSPSTTSRMLNPMMGERLISGPLMVESKGVIRRDAIRWKTKPSTIYLRGDHYLWQIGEKRSFPLQFGISQVEYYPNHPLSFIVYLNPSDNMAPVVKAACSNESDYQRWMSALTKATAGEDFAALPASSGAGEDEEASELQRILELSKRDV